MLSRHASTSGPPVAYGRRFRALTGILRSPIWQKQRCTQDIPLLQCCVERTLVVQDVKVFMDLKHQENSQKADIKTATTLENTQKAHIKTLKAKAASTLKQMWRAEETARSHQAPGEQPWPQQSPSLNASTICCTAVVDENECRCRGGR